MVDAVGDFWESFYNERDQVWSGRPNAMLVREVSGLAPGTAVDLGCGEGADAIWLASQAGRSPGSMCPRWRWNGRRSTRRRPE
ncbi:type 12 methyltransferase [Arthrobacter crystallopoietes BAB-32]|uniref:Type 12 methyltransferase n=1 Tax=Arthrobacter crystallopoietes BAB-32 TaxID=1246476 RepID=N1UPG4_9MICC|nr:hypothetical protein [Arthrobacter crystallopoietes]EMY32291.1 type 12 methyltransferase [Arthrobacter crystallopoietes BAB-32]